MTKNLIVALKCSVWNDESRKIRITQSNIASWKEQSSIVCDNDNDNENNQFNITCETLQCYLKFKIFQSISEEAYQCQSIKEYRPNFDIKIEVYDNHQSSSFISLLHDDVRDLDVEERFGKRLQCLAIILDNNNNEIQSHSFKKTSDETIPAIMGRYFPFDPDDGIDFAGGKLVLKEINNNQINATGLNIWDGAILMVKYLELFSDKVVSKRILELGSGCGTVGIAAGILGAKQVIMTDLPYTMKIMEHNVNSNKERIDESHCTKIECIACNWFDPPHISTFDFAIDGDVNDVYPDVVLIADCVWLDELVNPLFQTINKYISTATSSPKTEVIITYQRRGNATHQSFLSNLHKSFSLVNELSIPDHRLQYPENLFIYSCQK